uniref:Uncharacterized protein n=1 Tax=Steinernema glaseri TaxID=37863 RepID=A0A1I7ZCH2_9BILA
MGDNHAFQEEDDGEAERAHFYLDKDESSASQLQTTSGHETKVASPQDGLPPRAHSLGSSSSPAIVAYAVRASFQKNIMKRAKNKVSTAVSIPQDGSTQTHTQSSQVNVNGSRRASIFQTLRERIMHQPVTDFGVGDAKDPATEEVTSTSCCCSSWTKFVDTMGNRQTTFCKKLRKLRPCLIDAKLAMIKFGAELERELRPGPDNVCNKIVEAINEINTIICDSSLNIPPEDSGNMRRLTDELAVLLRVCTEVYDHWQLIQGIQNRPLTQSTANMAPLNVETKEGIDAIEKIDKVHSLKERIARNVHLIELQLVFIDKKCERRWWLKDLIRVLQAVMKLVVFISASISVAYHMDQAYPIATLVLTIAQGVIDMFDQLFVQRFDPKDINLQSSARTGTKPVPT